jgi:phosphatidate cytidylyltransferase
VKQRVITALIAIPVVLVAVLCTNPWPLAGLLLVAGSLALRELCHLLHSKLLPLFMALCLALLWTAASKIILGRGSVAWEVAGLTASWASGVIALMLVRGHYWTPIKVVLGSLWIIAPLRALLAIHGISFSSDAPLAYHWNSPVLLALLPIWAGDTAGILAGKFFGKHPLAPTISPKKTWEGAIGNFIAATALAAALGPALGYGLMPSLAIGVICGTFGQIGDLFESWLKRQAGAKDSGDLLPGHGGILDRIDSLLFSSIPVYAILAAQAAHR